MVNYSRRPLKTTDGLFETWRWKMSIYTRMGSPVQFVSARMLKVWTTIGNIGNGVELRWHYSEPKRTSRWRKDVKVEVMEFVWHAKANYLDGEPVCGGDEIPLSGFVADDAIQEIVAECYRLNPADAAREKAAFGEAA